MAKRVLVTISSKGNIYVETDGFKGDSCIQSIKSIFAEMVEIEKFEYKDEYYENEEEVIIKEKINL